MKSVVSLSSKTHLLLSEPKKSGLGQCHCFLLCFCRALSFFVSPEFLEKHKMSVIFLLVKRRWLESSNIGICARKRVFHAAIAKHLAPTKICFASNYSVMLEVSGVHARVSHTSFNNKKTKHVRSPNLGLRQVTKAP